MTDSGEQPPASNTTATPARPRSNWSAGRVFGMIFASIGGLIGLALLVGGIALMAAYAFGRDSDGYFTSDRKQLDSTTYAITTGNIDLGTDVAGWAPDQLLGNVRLRVQSGKPVFVGIGPVGDVDRYLGRVAHAQLVDFSGGKPKLDSHKGGPLRAPPGKQDFWVAKTRGSGEQALTWDANFGRWSAVVMNADGARGVRVTADAGIKLGWAIWVGLGMFVVGLLMSGSAVVVIVLIARGASRGPTTG